LNILCSELKRTKLTERGFEIDMLNASRAATAARHSSSLYGELLLLLLTLLLLLLLLLLLPPLPLLGTAEANFTCTDALLFAAAAGVDFSADDNDVPAAAGAADDDDDDDDAAAADADAAAINLSASFFMDLAAPNGRPIALSS
jgi:hypothetical protein